MNVKEFFSIEDFEGKLWLSVFGARVCYTKKDINGLLEETNLQDRQKAVEFLSRLCSYKHFSVFSHSFVYKDLKDKSIATFLAAKYFKSFWSEKSPSIIGVSLRHLLEDLDEEERLRALTKAVSFNENPRVLDQIENVKLVFLDKSYFGHAVFYLEDISRVMTHQLVRHTFLNFSQRSQRYVLQLPRKTSNITGLEMIIIPPSIRENEEALEIFLQTNKIANSNYLKLLEMKIPAEDARFILPHGQKTNIVVSAPIPHLFDFIRKRIEKGAQWEIRDIALKMKELLERQNCFI